MEILLILPSCVVDRWRSGRCLFLYVEYVLTFIILLSLGWHYWLIHVGLNENFYLFLELKDIRTMMTMVLMFITYNACMVGAYFLFMQGYYFHSFWWSWGYRCFRGIHDCFNLSNSGHIWIGCPNSSHNVQGCTVLEELEVSPVLSFCFALMATPVVVGTGWFCMGWLQGVNGW